MVKFRSFLLQSSATGHLETEEGTHGFLRGISLLLALLLFLWSLRGRSSGSFSLLWSNLGWLREDLTYKDRVKNFILVDKRFLSHYSDYNFDIVRR
jgi:hypothetical protein